MPQIVSVNILGSNISVQGTNGPPYGAYQLLTSTDVSLPLDQWSIVGSSTFDAGGNFGLTNSVSPVQLQQFFRLRLLP